jgi:hypothetical protein
MCAEIIVRTDNNTAGILSSNMNRLASKGPPTHTVHPWVQRRGMLMFHVGYRKISVLAHKIPGFFKHPEKSERVLSLWR